MANLKIHLGVISILVDDRQNHALEMNKLLTGHSHLIMSRLGVNVQPSCVKGCAGLVVLAVKGGKAEIKDLTKKLNARHGLIAKVNIMAN